MCSRWSEGSTCAFACTLINIRPAVCSPESQAVQGCLWCADVPESDCDSAFFDDPWVTGNTILRRCQLTTSGCRASEDRHVCESPTACMKPCQSKSCKELRDPPSGIRPLQCSQLRYLGCDCAGCCNEASPDQPAADKLLPSRRVEFQQRIHIPSHPNPTQPFPSNHNTTLT